MSRDAILTSDDGTRYSYDALTTQSFLEGHAPGAQAAASWLVDRAILLFRAGRDDEARLLRETAAALLKEVIPKLEKQKADHARDYPTKFDGKTVIKKKART